MRSTVKANKPFRTALISSILAHTALFLLILVSPSLPRSSRKGMIHYVNLISLPGGGAPGKGKGIEEEVKKKETLKDLTTPQNIQEETTSSLRHPVEKPKKKKKATSDKKAVIRQPQKKGIDKSKGKAKEEGLKGKSGFSGGAGLRIGLGSGPGTGSGYASQIGLSDFPFTYYLQIIMDRVSANWFTSLVDPGISGNFQTTVYFKIHRNGQISSVKVEGSSGIRSLDLSAIRAIQSSAPFPPLPREYDEEYLLIHLIFEHSK